jgi:hypothetical protein
MPEPLPAIPLQYAAPAPPRKERAALSACHVFALAACAATWLLILLVNVRVVVLAGPVIALAGVAVLTLGVIARERAKAMLGLAHVTLCFSLYLIVNLANWSPDDAQGPFAMIGGLYTLSAVAASAFLAARERRRPRVHLRGNGGTSS